jgi:UbiD family decarboxylase
MSYRSLQPFLADLEARKELIRIDAEVDPHLELAEIHRRVIEQEGPALLFTRVKGKRFPVVTNLFGTKQRVEQAFGKSPLEFVEGVVSLVQKMAEPSLSMLWKHKHLAWRALGIGVKKGNYASHFAHSISGADLTELPAITSWSEDGGPFLTQPLVHTRGKHGDNLGMYRIQIFDAHETGMHFQIGKGGGFHLAEAEAENRPLPVNIYLGGPPSLLFSAIAPLPENVSEFLLASLMMGSKLERHRGMNDPIVGFEFCLTGHVPPHVRRPEGPFGDHYGYYSLIHDYPVFRPQAIYHRSNAVFPATVVGKPRQEDFYIGDYLQELLSPLFPLVMPQVTSLWSYGETGFHSLSAAVIKERFAREAMTAGFRILGEGQLSLTKFLLLTDQPTDLRDFRATLRTILERVDWQTDLFIFSELAMDSLDYAGPKINHGSKGIIMGMGAKKRDLPKEFHGKDFPSCVRKVRVFVEGCLVVEVPGFAEDRSCIEAVVKHPAFADWPLIIAVDDADKTVASEPSFLWTTFTRFDPASDLHAAHTTVQRNRLYYQGPVLLDARMKPWYPKELFCDPDTQKLVDRRWQEYGIRTHAR